MIHALKTALSEGFRIQITPYVGKAMVHLSIKRYGCLFEFNKIVEQDDLSIEFGIRYTMDEIQSVMKKYNEEST